MCSSGGIALFLSITFCALFIFFTVVSLKFNIPEDRRFDIKVYDQSNTEVDSEVFEEIVKEFHGPFLVSLASDAPGNFCLLGNDYTHIVEEEVLNYVILFIFLNAQVTLSLHHLHLRHLHALLHLKTQ